MSALFRTYILTQTRCKYLEYCVPFLEGQIVRGRTLNSLKSWVTGENVERISFPPIFGEMMACNGQVRSVGRSG